MHKNPPASPNSTAFWLQTDRAPAVSNTDLHHCLLQVGCPLFLAPCNGALGAFTHGRMGSSESFSEKSHAYPVLAWVPALPPQRLGSKVFKDTHGMRYAYVGGAMAHGISSVSMVEELGRAGMIGFFGAGGLGLAEIENAIVHFQQGDDRYPYGFNLVYTPSDPAYEQAVVDLYLKKGVHLISASAYMDMTLPLVYYRIKGIHADSEGRIICPNRIVAKVSRIEVARKFLSPPPQKLLHQLTAKGLLTEQEARLAAGVPMAEDMTAEADSGGHTDNRPAIALLPTMLALRDEMAAAFNYPRPVCVGLGGGIATPDAAAAAFALGADYILTGSVNQSCVEAGTSATVRRMLAEASQADVTMAPSADMFEMGVKVQVLKRGTLFPFRAARLYDLYSRYDALEQIPRQQRDSLEKDFFRSPLETEWEQTKQFFAVRDPSQIQRAESDPKHKMALVFRSYLGRAVHWANTGEPNRQFDYQIWCGPAIGAFNEWVKGSFLTAPENRRVVAVGLNLMTGAAVHTRLNWIRMQGVSLAPQMGRFTPMEPEMLQRLTNET